MKTYLIYSKTTGNMIHTVKAKSKAMVYRMMHEHKTSPSKYRIEESLI